MFVTSGSALKPNPRFSDLRLALANGRVLRFAMANPERADRFERTLPPITAQTRAIRIAATRTEVFNAPRGFGRAAFST